MHCRNSLQVSLQNNGGGKSEIFECLLTSWDFENGAAIRMHWNNITRERYLGIPCDLLLLHPLYNANSNFSCIVCPSRCIMVQGTSHCSGGEISPICLKLFTVPRSHLCCALPPICIIASCLPIPLSVFKIFILPPPLSPQCGSLSRVPI